MRVLIVFALAALASAQIKPRVLFFNDKIHQVRTREDAMMLCQNMNMHIAHEAQLVADIEDGYTGHHQCGWTWTRGRRVHVHCTEKVADGSRCKPFKAEVRGCHEEQAGLSEPSGIYCRSFGNDEERPRFIIEPGDLIEVYRAAGPNGPDTLMNVAEAKAVCESEGNTLAYWSQVAAYVERYGIQFCKYSWLREGNAVFNANCHHNDEIGWDVRDPSKGYDAICYGRIPHKYIDPCTNNFEFTNLEGIPVYCSDDGYVIIQDRPPCGQEQFSFKQEWSQYRKGFGDIGKGYWLGLEILAKLTKAYNFELVVEVVSDGGQKYTARYAQFSVGGVEDQYRLKVDGYSGDAGDMFNEIQSNALTSNGAMFSTDKHDNDGSEVYNCAREYSSGWWFQSCHLDNLNGPCPAEPGYAVGISATRTWRKVSNNTPGLRSTRMKIKFVSDDRQ